jgi:hypothetical protein
MTSRHGTDTDPGGGRELEPIRSLADPRAVQIMSTEHWGLLSARSLAYNEAFTRGGMFLTFLSMSFIALALVAQATSFGTDFLTVAAVVLGFDLVIGLTTWGRIVGANGDDYRVLHGINRIRHAYVEIAPVVVPYLTLSPHDDRTGVLVNYGSPPQRGFGAVLYALTTSSGMIGLIVSLLAGVLGFVVTLMLGRGGWPAFGVAAVAALVLFAALATFGAAYFSGQFDRTTVRFPTPTVDDAEVPSG